MCKNTHVVYSYTSLWASLVGNLKPTPTQSDGSKSDLPNNSCERRKLIQLTSENHTAAEVVHLIHVIIHRFWLPKVQMLQSHEASCPENTEVFIGGGGAGFSQHKMWVWNNVMVNQV